MSLVRKCQRIAMILSDVDGVLTKGGVLLDGAGNELVQFNVRDGLGIRLWRESGGQFGFVTGRDVPAVRVRAEKLGIDVLRLGIDDKLPVVHQIRNTAGFDLEQICFVGDDLLDLSVIGTVGLGIAVADAVEEVRSAADYVTSVPGGHGAVREVVELILKNTGRWEDMVERFFGAA